MPTQGQTLCAGPWGENRQRACPSWGTRVWAEVARTEVEMTCDSISVMSVKSGYNTVMGEPTGVAFELVIDVGEGTL